MALIDRSTLTSPMKSKPGEPERIDWPLRSMRYAERVAARIKATLRGWNVSGNYASDFTACRCVTHCAYGVEATVVKWRRGKDPRECAWCGATWIVGADDMPIVEVVE